jgi:hypothetical protein
VGRTKGREILLHGDRLQKPLWLFGPADSVDKRPDDSVEISVLEIPTPFIHVVPTAVSCQEVKTGKV